VYKRGRVGRFVKFFAKYENEKKYVKNIIQLTEAQLTEKEIKAVEMRVSK
jgi:hypothetical protein